MWLTFNTLLYEIILTLNDASCNRLEGVFMQGIDLFKQKQSYHASGSIQLMTGLRNYEILATSAILNLENFE